MTWSRHPFVSHYILPFRFWKSLNFWHLLYERVRARSWVVLRGTEIQGFRACPNFDGRLTSFYPASRIYCVVDRAWRIVVRGTSWVATAHRDFLELRNCETKISISVVMSRSWPVRLSVWLPSSTGSNKCFRSWINVSTYKIFRWSWGPVIFVAGALTCPYTIRWHFAPREVIWLF